MNPWEVEDYTPQQAAHEAARDVLYVIGKHPGLPADTILELEKAYRLLKEIADE